MRQRIVINLDEQKAGGVTPVRKRRRWPRVLAIFAFVVLVFLVVAAVGGFLLFRRYQSSPTYALALLLDAAQRNDVAEFQTHIDEEAIAKNMTASVSQKAAARYGYALNSSIQQQIDSALTAQQARVKQAVRDEFLNAMKAFGGAPEQRSFISLLGAVQSLMTVTTEGDSARATGNTGGHNLELALRHDADGWKVIEVKDDLITQRIVDNVMKELPAIGNTDLPFPKKTKPKRSRRRR